MPGVDSLIDALAKSGGPLGILIAVIVFGYAFCIMVLVAIMKSHREERDAVVKMYSDQMNSIEKLHQGERAEWRQDMMRERVEERRLHERANELHDRTNQVLNDIRVLLAPLHRRD